MVKTLNNTIEMLTKNCEGKLYSVVLNDDIGACEIQWNENRLDEFTDELAAKFAKEMGVINALPDEVAVELAKRDGVKLIPPSELPISFEKIYEGWIDTPANRAAIAKDAEMALHFYYPLSDCPEFYKLTDTVYEANGETFTLDTLEPFTPEDRKKWGMEATMELAVQQFTYHNGNVIPENELPTSLPRPLKERVYQDTPETRAALQKIADIEQAKETIKNKKKADVER